MQGLELMSIQPNQLLNPGLTVTVIMVHLSQHVDRVRVERKVGAINDAKGIQLMPKCTLSEDKLGGIGSVQAIHTICSTYPILE